MADAKNIRLQLAPDYSAAAAFDTVDLKNASGGAVRVGWVAMAIDHNSVITHVGFRQGTTTGTPASGSYKIGLYTVDGSGLPTATDLGGGSPTEVTFQPTSGNDGAFIWVALTNSVTIARGTFFSIVLQNNADTSANGITCAHRGNTYGWGPNNSLPYELTYAASAWTKGSSAFRQPVFGFKSSTAVYGFTSRATEFATTISTSGQRATCKFTLPDGWGNTFKIKAVRGAFRVGAAAGSYIAGIWNGAGTLLQGGTLDSDISRALGANNNMDLAFADATLPTLSFGTTYYAGIESVSSSSISVTNMLFSDANDQLAFPLGTDVAYSTWNGSAWSDTTTSRPIVTLVLDDITSDTGGSGLPKLIGNNSLLG